MMAWSTRTQRPGSGPGPVPDGEEVIRRELQELRKEFPNWGFLVLHKMWVAVRGKSIMVTADTPTGLRAGLPPAPADPPVVPALATTWPMTADDVLPGAMTCSPTIAGVWPYTAVPPVTTRRARQPGRRRRGRAGA